MRQIDINTSQNVSINYQLASVSERFLAFILDLVIVFIFEIGIFFLLSLSKMQGDGWQDIIMSIMAVVTFLLYQFCCEAFLGGQSLGKKAVGIKVVRLDGDEASMSDYFLRSVFYILDFYFSAGAIAGVLIASTEKGQRTGDMAANTGVIRTKIDERFRLEDILKINTLDQYEPSYPMITQMGEQDMLLIKNSVQRWEEHRNQAHWEVICDLVKRLESTLSIKAPSDKIQFLKILIRDYIVLTR